MPNFRTTLLSSMISLCLTGMANADVTIGLAVPRTGSVAAVGDQILRGVTAAVDDINAKGGILGQKIVLSVGDDACDPKQALSVANNFIQSHIQLVVGHVCSGASIVVSDVYAENGVLMVTPASNSAKLTDRGLKGIFRVCGRDDEQGVITAAIIAKRFAGRKIAILHDNAAFGRGMADATKLNLNKLGVQEALFTSITPGERDYIAIVTRLKAAGIDLVYYGGYPQELGQIVRQSADQGYHPQFFGTSGLASAEFWTIAGPAAEGVLFTFNPDPRKRSEATAVVDAFHARGVEPDGFTLYGYAALQAIAAGANKAGSTDPHAVEAALKSNSFDLILGTVAFKENGDISAPGYVLYTWKNGKFDYATE